MRQAHEGPQAGGRQLTILGGGYTADNRVRILVGAGGILSGAAPQKIQ
jgi:hypothetical protein